jgi:hypothetical protein
MAQIPLGQYIARDEARGGIGATPGGAPRVDLSPVVNQLGRIAANVQRERAELEHAQESERRRLAHNEAVGYATNIDSQADIEWTERLQKAADDPKGMTERVLKEYDAYKTEAVKNAPDGARPIVEQNLTRKRASLHSQAFSLETKTRQAAVLQADDQGTDADSRAVYANPALFMEKLAGRLAANKTLDIPEPVKAARMQKARETLAYAAASAMAERDPSGFLAHAGMAGGKTDKHGKTLPSDPDEAAKRVASDPVLSNMDPRQLQEVVNRATMLKLQAENAAAAERERAIRMAEMAAARRDREATQAYTILSDRAREGIATDPVADGPLINKLAGTPFQAAYQQIAATVPARAAAAMQPLAVQQARLDALYAKRAQSGTSTALEHEIKQSEEVFSAAKRDYTEDPLRAAAKRGLGEVAPLEMKGGLTAMLQQIGPRVAQADAITPLAGKPVSPLLQEEADQLAGWLAKMPPEQKALSLSQLSSAVGQRQAQAIAQQVDKQDRSLSLALRKMGEKTTSGRLIGELILKGALAKKDGTSTKGEKAPEVPETVWKPHITTAIGSTYLDKQQSDDVRDAALFIAHGIASEQGGSLEADDMRRAVNMAVGGPMVEHNGRKVPLPAGFDQDMLEKRLSTVTPADLAQQAPGGTVRAAGVQIPLAQFVGALPGQQLAPVSRGRYVVLVQGRPVTNDKGDPIVIGVN